MALHLNIIYNFFSTAYIPPKKTNLNSESFCIRTFIRWPNGLVRGKVVGRAFTYPRLRVGSSYYNVYVCDLGRIRLSSTNSKSHSFYFINIIAFTFYFFCIKKSGYKIKIECDFKNMKISLDTASFYAGSNIIRYSLELLVEEWIK